MPNIWDLFTDDAKKMVERSREEAALFGHETVGTEHLLLACLWLGDPIAARALTHLGITRDDVREKIAQMVAPSQVHIEGAPPSSDFRDAIDGSPEEAQSLGAHRVAPEHILLSLLRDENLATKALSTLGHDSDEVYDLVVKFINGYGAELERLARPLGDTGLTVGQAHDLLGINLSQLATLLDALQVPNLDRRAAIDHAPVLEGLLEFLVATDALDDSSPEYKAVELLIEELLGEHHRQQPDAA